MVIMVMVIMVVVLVVLVMVVVAVRVVVVDRTGPSGVPPGLYAYGRAPCRGSLE